MRATHLRWANWGVPHTQLDLIWTEELLQTTDAIEQRNEARPPMPDIDSTLFKRNYKRNI